MEESCLGSSKYTDSKATSWQAIPSVCYIDSVEYTWKYAEGLWCFVFTAPVFPELLEILVAQGLVSINQLKMDIQGTVDAIIKIRRSWDGTC